MVVPDRIGAAERLDQHMAMPIDANARRIAATTAFWIATLVGVW